MFYLSTARLGIHTDGDLVVERSGQVVDAVLLQDDVVLLVDRVRDLVFL